MESRKIPDSSITASSYGSSGYAPKNGRLNNNKYWHPLYTESNPYFQVRTTLIKLPVKSSFLEESYSEINSKKQHRVWFNAI